MSRNKYFYALHLLLILVSAEAEAFVVLPPFTSLTSSHNHVGLANKPPKELREASEPGEPGYPDVIGYPGDGWGLSKPKPKKSLKDLGTDGSAKAWILNIIQFFHWFSFPIGFTLLWVLFCNAKALGAAINPTNPKFGLFAILMAHTCQIFGGGISGNMMHQYEGWQVAEFRNPLRPYKDEKEPDFNDAWLRAVAYQMLFSFQTLGVLFTALAVYGIDRWWMKTLIGITAFTISLAPQLPHCTTVFPKLMSQFKWTAKIWTLITKDRPVFPLSIWLFGIFIVNTIFASAAYVNMFGRISWTGKAMPWLAKAAIAMIPFGLVGIGGIYEGLRAETTFVQWDHLLAFLFLDAGLALHIPFYLKLL